MDAELERDADSDDSAFLDEGVGGCRSGPMSLQRVSLELRRLADRERFVVLPATTSTLSEVLFHPAAFELLTGESEGSIAFEQPVYRPLDHRGTGHPTRRAAHLQWAFVLRSRLREGQALALAVLRAAGLEPEDHDLRFSDLAWESRALDARGTGWRLEVDGLRVARICALDRFAGRAPRRPSMVASVGVERLAMIGAGVERLDRLKWSPKGPSLAENGEAMSSELGRWVEEVAEPEMLAGELGEGLATARRAMAGGLPRVACRRLARVPVLLDQLAVRGLLSAREHDRRLGEIRKLVRRLAEVLQGIEPEDGERHESGRERAERQGEMGGSPTAPDDKPADTPSARIHAEDTAGEMKATPDGSGDVAKNRDDRPKAKAAKKRRRSKGGGDD